jgi:hypothetical protein
MKKINESWLGLWLEWWNEGLVFGDPTLFIQNAAERSEESPDNCSTHAGSWRRGRSHVSRRSLWMKIKKGTHNPLKIEKFLNCKLIFPL